MQKTTFERYEDAYRAAVLLARETGCDVGLEHNKLFHTYMLSLLPRPEFRQGFELRCEVVTATDPLI